MTFTLVGELPRHLYCYVDSSVTHKEPCGFVPCVWFGLVSYPGRLWGCTVMLESGAVYRNIPAHAIAFDPEPEPDHAPQDAQTSDCYGERFSCIEYRYLSGLDCIVKTRNGIHEGVYLFSVAPIGDGFSAYPEQAKEFCFVETDGARLTIQPTNNVVFRERSFTGLELRIPEDLKRQSEIWSCE